MRRKWFAVACNVIVPGSGLVLLQREWLGVTLAMLFALSATTGVWAVFITPAAVPLTLAIASLTLAALVWLGAQLVMRRRVQTFRNPELLIEVRHVCEQAAERVAAGDYDTAHRLLNVALTLDDEDVETNVQLAELLTLIGHFRPARRAWLRVGRLDRAGAYRRHVAGALDRLPAR